uniref:SMC5-SMC6 complex localization factor 2 n=1 Tax=Xenopus tropicalis TaxID=8364 RepID=A0A803JWK7_XENTR
MTRRGSSLSQGSRDSAHLFPGVGQSVDRSAKNQHITAFFKPALRTDSCKLELSQAEDGCLKKLSSAKRQKRLPVKSPNRSPIMEAFLQRGKSEKLSALIGKHNCDGTISEGDSSNLDDRHVVSKRRLFSNDVPNTENKRRDEENKSELFNHCKFFEQNNGCSGGDVSKPKIHFFTSEAKGQARCLSLEHEGSVSPEKGKENILLITRGLCSLVKENESTGTVLLVESTSQSLSSDSSKACEDMEAESIPSQEPSSSSSFSESDSSFESFSFSTKRPKRLKTKFRKRSSSSDEEALMSLENYLKPKPTALPSTPQQPLPSTSPFSSPMTPFLNNNCIAATPEQYANSLSRLVKEKKESERVKEIEKKLQEDIEKGQSMQFLDTECDTDEGDIEDEHREFLQKYSIDLNGIPDQPPGEEIFHLDKSGLIFNHHTLDLRNSEYSAQSSEENVIFRCGAENQFILATEGFLSFLYRYKTCPVVLMKWMFQIVAVHPSYTIGIKLLNTLIKITSNNLSNSKQNEAPWMPSLLDVATVFMNMGVDFDMLFPLPHLQPVFCCDDLVPAVPLSLRLGNNKNGPTQAFTTVPEMQMTNVIKYLGYCTAVYPEIFSDQDTLLLIVLLLKIHLETQLKSSPIVDLHVLVGNLLHNFRDWEIKMPELSLALRDISTHHHNYVKIVQLVPSTESRGRQLRGHLSLAFISKLLNENCPDIPLDYSAQMSLLCQCLSKMKPSALIRKMQSYNEESTQHNLDQEGYYLTYSLLTLVNAASSSDEGVSVQRTYLLKLCAALEKHIKCDIREDARYYYRTKVKDLVARIYGKWQEILHCSRPHQVKYNAHKCIILF